MSTFLPFSFSQDVKTYNYLTDSSQLRHLHEKLTGAKKAGEEQPLTQPPMQQQQQQQQQQPSVQPNTSTPIPSSTAGSMASLVTDTMPTPTLSTVTTPAVAPTAGGAPAAQQSAAPVPQFSFHDLNTSSLAGLAPHIAINAQVSGPAADFTS